MRNKTLKLFENNFISHVTTALISQRHILVVLVEQCHEFNAARIDMS